MLVSLNWLREYVNIDGIEIQELAEIITKSGIEVDGIHNFAKNSTGVYTGYVESCEKHPEANKLNVCTVDINAEKLQIVCGASNISKGQIVSVAKPGAILPGNIKIKETELHGIQSHGMICSLQELGIEERYVPKEYESGIFVFPMDTKIGEPVENLLNLKDSILEFDLTPNRADCLNMLGVGYEVAAILDETLYLPEVSVQYSEEETKKQVSIEVDATDLNPYYAAFIIENIEVKEAPLWMRNYLMAAGIRPINNIVDITNYVLLEYGQPLHAFDFDLFDSNKILVRRAKQDEKLITLDNQKRILDGSNLVITNGKDPVALAGVMGGASTEIHHKTNRVLLEAAYFDGSSIRSTVKVTGLRSEASTRYEKGLDPNRVFEAGLRACQLLEKYANATVLKDPVVFDELNRSEKIVTVCTNEVNKRLGTEIESLEIADILKKLRFKYEQTNDSFIVTIPTRRQDITIFEDMLEEIARIYGYDHLPFTLPKGEAEGQLSEKQRLKRYTKGFLEGNGLFETVTYSLVDDVAIQKFIAPDIEKMEPIPVKLALPLTEEHKNLRLSLLPELLSVVAYNSARNMNNVALFELGSVFVTDEVNITKQPNETLRLSGAISGKIIDHPWQKADVSVDFYVIKGIIEGLFSHLDIPVEFEDARVHNMHPGRTASIIVKDEVIGFIGQIHPFDQKQLDLKETYVFDINMDEVFESYSRVPTFSQIPKFPSVSRDIAFIADIETQAGEIKEFILEKGTPLVQAVEIFDVYEGSHLEENKKSIAYRLTYQNLERTLTDDEVEKSYRKILEAVNDKYEAFIRKN